MEKSKIYGYCRISTKKQSLERQIKNISKEFPAAEIITEVYTGTKSQRPNWAKLLKKVKSGDTIVFDSVSRMARNAEEGLKQYFELNENGVNLVFLHERHIDTSTYKDTLSNSVASVGNEIADIYIEATNKVLRLLAEKQIRQAFEQAEKEVSDLHYRTSEGMRASGACEKISEARTGKKYETQKSVEAKATIKKHSKTFGGSLSDGELLKMLGISRNSLYKYKSELKNEMEEAA